MSLRNVYSFFLIDSTRRGHGYVYLRQLFLVLLVGSPILSPQTSGKRIINLIRAVS